MLVQAVAAWIGGGEAAPICPELGGLELASKERAELEEWIVRRPPGGSGLGHARRGGAPTFGRPKAGVVILECAPFAAAPSGRGRAEVRERTGVGLHRRPARFAVRQGRGTDARGQGWTKRAPDAQRL